MSNRFPISTMHHPRNVKYTVDCHARVIDEFRCSDSAEEISSDLFFARSIYTVQPCDATSVTTRQPLLATHVVLSTFGRHLILFYPSRSLLHLVRSASLLPLGRNSRSNLLSVIPFNSSSHRNGDGKCEFTRQTSLSGSSCARNTSCRLLFVAFRSYSYVVVNDGIKHSRDFRMRTNRETKIFG